MKVTINKIRSIVTKELGGTDTGTITGANSVGASVDGVVTVAISAALNEEDSASQRNQERCLSWITQVFYVGFEDVLQT